MAKSDKTDNTVTKEGGQAESLYSLDLTTSSPPPSSPKPKPDLISSEVKENLPDINVDSSAVVSDSDEQMLFNRHLKSFEDSQDRDSSQGSDLLEDLTASAQKANSKQAISDMEAAMKHKKKKVNQTTSVTDTTVFKSQKPASPRTQPKLKQFELTQPELKQSELKLTELMQPKLMQDDNDPPIFEQNCQNEQEFMTQIQKRISVPPDQSHSHPSDMMDVSKMQSQSRDTGVGKPPDGQTTSSSEASYLQPVKKKVKKHKSIKKPREQLEQEQQAKLRLKKCLDDLRPSTSISGKQRPAENTPTVFDLEASYETAPRSLPPMLTENTDCILLTIRLSSNGEIAFHKGYGNKSVATGIGLPASYTVLLTWFLTMVPQDFTFLQDSSVECVLPWDVPFYVIGLQQLLMDGQLCLMVAITPTTKFTAMLPNKSKKNKNDTTFRKYLQKYLSNSTIDSVCPWFQNFVIVNLTLIASKMAAKNTDDVFRRQIPVVTTKQLSSFITINPDPQAATKVFSSSVGFFWQTVDNDESRLDQDIHDEGVNFDTQNALSVLYKKIYHNPTVVCSILIRALHIGLDLAGVRLVYPTREQVNIREANSAAQFSELELVNKVGAVLAICIRGASARTFWLAVVGQPNPVLAHPMSFYALYCSESGDECNLFCPRTPTSIQTELARWFGDRVPPSNVINVGKPYSKKDALQGGSPKKGKWGKKETIVNTEDFSILSQDSIDRPLATLTATTRSEILFVVSPVVMPKFIGSILSSFHSLAYVITGVKRCRLSMKKATALGIPENGLKAYCPGFVPESFKVKKDSIGEGHTQETSIPSTIFQLLKENASHNASSLIEDCVLRFSRQGIIGKFQECENYSLQTIHLFHIARYSDSLIAALGGEFSKCFDSELIGPNYVFPTLYSNPEMEQVAVILFLGHNAIQSSGEFIYKVFGKKPNTETNQDIHFFDSLELLGMKWVPCLTFAQAKEVTPYEVVDKHWKESVYALINVPCLAFAFRGVHAYSKLEAIVPHPVCPDSMSQDHNLRIIFSRTAQSAYVLIKQFFTVKELFSDQRARLMVQYMPRFLHQPDSHDTKLKVTGTQKDKNTSPPEETIFEMMLAGPRPFTTFLIIKPSAFKNHFSLVLKKLAQEEFVIVGLRLCVLTVQDSLRLLSETDEKEKHMQEKHIEHLTSGPSLLLVVQRENAVWKLAVLLGPEDPQSARRSSRFFWRGLFGTDIVANGFYSSTIYSGSLTDQSYFFPEGLCCEQTEVTMLCEIKCPAIDRQLDLKHDINREVIYVREHQGTDSPDITHGQLLQTTCIVLTPLLFRKVGSCYRYVDIIDGLVSQGFEFVGARMLWFTQEQAEHFLTLIEAGNFKLVPFLIQGPSIVLALERDHAVLAFDRILDATYITESCEGELVTESLLHMYNKLILRPTNIKQAHAAIGYFFQELLPKSQLQIVNKNT